MFMDMIRQKPYENSTENNEWFVTVPRFPKIMVSKNIDKEKQCLINHFRNFFRSKLILIGPLEQCHKSFLKNFENHRSNQVSCKFFLNGVIRHTRNYFALFVQIMFQAFLSITSINKNSRILSQNDFWHFVNQK